MNDRAARNAGAPGSGGVPQRGNFSLEADILSKLRDVPVKIVAADTNAELLHDVLASLRQKALDLQNDKWMYKELSFL
ncbi:hypothetical protein, variant 1 [Aphanomyces astaci]|uniref:Uncharacterized protein n=1 Tax=Aphanomyces astaci TaxID=112090 RepID=W4GSS1_APHAT|nr:hypothetical protein H257_04548 [Aphanomyces astaci]XP_009827420.1 hypothetical protein, variant 1 [Aphanomyces astaci]ETV82747.1 hypothetical protein H257_04548 [Aphanomyces astaci]ETV82748.1 hypothetical protein, variant 1 [Aphanomyces astaci]|eukprot:XP_009827418.1 hypothetical protein H257_04548 [Aphanomyces astaci]